LFLHISTFSGLCMLTVEKSSINNFLVDKKIKNGVHDEWDQRVPNCGLGLYLVCMVVVPVPAARHLTVKTTTPLKILLTLQRFKAGLIRQRFTKTGLIVFLSP
jgi:hypothetical protein